MNVVVRPRRFRERVFHSIVGESMCERSHADSCDVNSIVKRYHRTGELPPPRHEPIYEDVTGLQGDFRDRLDFLGRVRAQVQAWYEDQAKQAESAAAASPKSPDTPPAS